MYSAEDDYARAGFGSTLGRGRSPALIVVDMVMAYTDPSSSLYAPVDGAVASAARIATVARAGGFLVVQTRVEYAPGGVDGGIFYKKVPALSAFDRGSSLGSIIPALGPDSSDVIVTKQYASAFFGTSLASTLAASAIDSVVVVGLTTSGCVRATALDAMQHGFIPLVVADAVGDRNEAVQQANLFDLGQKYADIIDEATAISILGV